jgi:ubiquitin-protein ligase E3 B
VCVCVCAGLCQFSHSPPLPAFSLPPLKKKRDLTTTQVNQLVRQLLFFYDSKRDTKNLTSLCALVVKGSKVTESSTPDSSIPTVGNYFALSEEKHTAPWVFTLTRFAHLVLSTLAAKHAQSPFESDATSRILLLTCRHLFCFEWGTSSSSASSDTFIDFLLQSLQHFSYLTVLRTMLLQRHFHKTRTLDAPDAIRDSLLACALFPFLHMSRRTRAVDQILSTIVHRILTIPIVSHYIPPAITAISTDDEPVVIQAALASVFASIIAVVQQQCTTGQLKSMYIEPKKQRMLGIPAAAFLASNLAHLFHHVSTNDSTAHSIAAYETFMDVIVQLVRVPSTNAFTTKSSIGRLSLPPWLLNNTKGASDLKSHDDPSDYYHNISATVAMYKRPFEDAALARNVVSIIYQPDTQADTDTDSKRPGMTAYSLEPTLATPSEYTTRFMSFNVRHTTFLPVLSSFLMQLFECFPNQQYVILSAIGFGTPLLSSLYQWLDSQLHVDVLIKSKKGWQQWENHVLHDGPVQPVYTLFVLLYRRILFVLEDAEFSESKVPFPTPQHLCAFSRFCKLIVFRHLRSGAVMSRVVEESHKLLMELYRRDVRLKFAPPSVWIISKDEDKDYYRSFSSDHLPPKHALEVLKELPFTVAFDRRIRLFRAYVEQDKKQREGKEPTHEIVVRRSSVLADAFSAIDQLGDMFRHPLKVKFLDDHGNAEQGIDMGGPWKEFLEILTKDVFRKEYGLFEHAPDGSVYPNPAAAMFGESIANLRHVGAIIGKVLYDGILVDVPFAEFFLCKVLSQPTFLSHLQSLDPQLHKNLLFVKSYTGNVEDLALVFSVDDPLMGTHELRPRGSDMSVTNDNRISYVYMVADFKLNKSISQQCQAFNDGLASVIPPYWLRMFNVKELQHLISGNEVDIDVDDWQAHAQYHLCTSMSTAVRWFWSIVRDMKPDERRKVLHFATACSRPPLMGFKYLNPPFTIRVVPAAGDEKMSTTDRVLSFFGRSSKSSKAALPTTSTCFNLLKLPDYSSKSVLRQKLKQAMHATGFYLS